MRIEPREWDSCFFGYPVGSYSFTDIPDPVKDIGPVLHQAICAGIRLLYISTPPLHEHRRQAIQRLGAKPVGIKVDFAKSICEAPSADLVSEISRCQANSPALRSLALESGLHSRFRLDEGFKHHEYERLYGEWLDSSLREDGGKQVYVAGPANSPRGLITVEPGSPVRIGLLAVDAQSRGQGVGHRLIAAAENYCILHDQQHLHVATQAGNHTACRFYKNCGFHLFSETEYFHCWLPLNETMEIARP